MDLYERFLSKENFELAYSRLKHAPNNAYKFFYEKDLDVFGFLLGNNIEQLINEIKSNTNIRIAVRRKNDEKIFE